MLPGLGSGDVLDTDLMRMHRERRQRLEGRLGEVVALEQGDARRLQRRELGRRLDAFGQHRDVELAGDEQGRREDRLAGAAGVDAAHEMHVDLDQVGLEIGEQAQSGIAGAEIVEGRDEAHLAVLGDDVLQMRDIGHLLALGELEHDRGQREAALAGGRKGCAQAGGRLVNGVGQEVDRQMRQFPGGEQPRRQRDRLHPAGLVEAVFLVGRDLRQDAVGALPVEAPHQGLVAPDPLRRDVEDGLEGHGELEVQRAGSLAAGAGGFGHGQQLVGAYEGPYCKGRVV